MISPPPPVPPKRAGVLRFDVMAAPCSFKATEPNHLDFEEGEVVTILEKLGNQWRVRIRGREGFIPAEILADTEPMDHPLHEAAKRGNVPFVKELMATGMSVNSLDASGSSPLLWAARSGHLDVVKLLLAGNPTLTCQNRLGDTCLHVASWGGHADVLKLLVQQPGIEEVLMVKNQLGKTALELAKNTECGAVLQAFAQRVRGDGRGRLSDPQNEEPDSDND